MTIEFTPFRKIARLSRDVVITEKLDGTNAAVRITPASVGDLILAPSLWLAVVNGLAVYAQSRSRFITLANDNFGFARWVADHASQLVALGEGTHFGEWWGSGIQRSYGLSKGEKRFSLFNTGRWKKGESLVSEKAVEAPECCHVVPVLYVGNFTASVVGETMADLKEHGSYAVPFMNPEGIILYHTAASEYFKKTFVGDEAGKEFGA